MSQDQWITLLLKIGLIAGLAAIGLWACVYTKLARWWENPVGITLVLAEALVGALFVPFILSLFFHMTRLGSYIVAWTDVSLIGLVAPVMLWRSVVFLRMGPSPARVHRDPVEPPPAQPEEAFPGE